MVRVPISRATFTTYYATVEQPFMAATAAARCRASKRARRLSSDSLHIHEPPQSRLVKVHSSASGEWLANSDGSDGLGTAAPTHVPLFRSVSLAVARLEELTDQKAGVSTLSGIHCVWQKRELELPLGQVVVENWTSIDSLPDSSLIVTDSEQTAPYSNSVEDRVQATSIGAQTTSNRRCVCRSSSTRTP